MPRKPPQDPAPPDEIPALIQAALHHLESQLGLVPTVTRVSDDEFTLAVSNERVQLTGTFVFRNGVLHFDDRHLWVDGREIVRLLGHHLAEIFVNPDMCGFAHSEERHPGGQLRFDPRAHTPARS